MILSLEKQRGLWARLNQKTVAERTRPEPDRPPDAKERRCLSCTQPFLSEGIHNRMCFKCRSKS